jgi:hypothetical protein
MKKFVVIILNTLLPFIAMGQSSLEKPDDFDGNALPLVVA